MAPRRTAQAAHRMPQRSRAVTRCQQPSGAHRLAQCRRSQARRGRKPGASPCALPIVSVPHKEERAWIDLHRQDAHRRGRGGDAAIDATQRQRARTQAALGMAWQGRHRFGVGGHAAPADQARRRAWAPQLGQHCRHPGRTHSLRTCVSPTLPLSLAHHALFVLDCQLHEAAHPPGRVCPPCLILDCRCCCQCQRRCGRHPGLAHSLDLG
mmetsp:Transcript_33551/g.87030  ORF Transcript_33551/g.87030 Transcript_33551/m.87030 type:complete len:210 (-) Transcript_33551:301-930(-)